MSQSQSLIAESSIFQSLFTVSYNRIYLRLLRLFLLSLRCLSLRCLSLRWLSLWLLSRRCLSLPYEIHQSSEKQKQSWIWSEFPYLVHWPFESSKIPDYSHGRVKMRTTPTTLRCACSLFASPVNVCELLAHICLYIAKVQRDLSNQWKVHCPVSSDFTLCENHPKCLIWIFAFWHFPPIFVLLKLTCLVTLFDRKL